MFIILLMVLLFASLFGSAVMWNVCWKMKKSELISGLHLQYLYHMKQEKDLQEAAQHYQQLAAAAAREQQQLGGEQLAQPDPHLSLSPHSPRRKLYFSPGR